MYSHRDHRAYHDAYRLLGLAVALTVALVALAALLAAAWAGLACLLGLALVGTGSLVASRRLVEGYVRDLRAVHAGNPVPGSLRVEVESSVEVDRERRRRAGSPNVRRRGVGSVSPPRTGGP